MPIGPGVVCEMAVMSVKAVSVSHPRTLTTWFWISEIIAPPPPKLNSPMMKKV